MPSPVIHNEIVPPDIEKLFAELKSYTGEDEQVEDPDAGLRYQYRLGLISKPTIESIVQRGRQLKRMMEVGTWQP